EQLPLSGLAGKHDWGGFPDSREKMSDWRLACWSGEFLTKQHSKPFFLACGIVKPHTPWYVPKEYFDLFPPDKITIADLAADENAGLPEVVRATPKDIKQEATEVARRKEMDAAYLAASGYADDCGGRILGARVKGTFSE